VRPVLIAVLLAGCVDTTGSALVSFRAAAAGPADAAGAPLATVTGTGYDLLLTEATVRIGAVYLKVTRPRPGSQEQPCVLTGPVPFYSGEVRRGLSVDLLRSDPQAFPVPGDGTADPSPVGEVWLVGDGAGIDTDSDDTIIAEVAGTAGKAGTTSPFVASITISAGNRGLPTTDPAQPGAHPICRQRIVTPIAAGLTPAPGGTLLVRADPRRWFDNVDFAAVPADPDVPGRLRFPDTNDDQQSRNLFNTFRAISTYTLTFTPGSPQ
jgi:hypothetical protein